MRLSTGNWRVARMTAVSWSSLKEINLHAPAMTA